MPQRHSRRGCWRARLRSETRSRPPNGPVERRRRARSPEPRTNHAGRSNRLLDDRRPASSPLARFAGPPGMWALEIRAAGAGDVRSIWPDGEKEDCHEKAEDPRTEKVDAGIAT